MTNEAVTKIRQYAQSILASTQELESMVVDPSWTREYIDNYLHAVVRHLDDADRVLGATVEGFMDEMIP